jgi:hypothetical protein
VKILLMGSGKKTERLESRLRRLPVGNIEISHIDKTKGMNDFHRFAGTADFIVLADYNLGVAEILELGFMTRSFFSHKGGSDLYWVFAPKPLGAGFEVMGLFLERGCRLYRKIDEIVGYIESLNIGGQDVARPAP